MTDKEYGEQVTKVYKMLDSKFSKKEITFLNDAVGCVPPKRKKGLVKQLMIVLFHGSIPNREVFINI
jgi:hypothetical protein